MSTIGTLGTNVMIFIFYYMLWIISYNVFIILMIKYFTLNCFINTDIVQLK